MALKGLVLCGGKSTRMQQDKSNITYHGKPQWQYLSDLLGKFLNEVWLSGRAEQAFPDGVNFIPDSVENGGPSAGLLSAHTKDPGASWLVLACDLPLISAQSIELLIRSRDNGKAATSFISPFNNSPEPLIAIWEPLGLQQLAKDFSEGKSCPRKTMLRSDIHLLTNPYAGEQFNANTPEEMKDALDQLG